MLAVSKDCCDVLVALDACQVLSKYKELFVYNLPIAFVFSQTGFGGLFALMCFLRVQFNKN